MKTCEHARRVTFFMRSALIACLMTCANKAAAQHFELEKQTDSLFYLTLRTDSTINRWRLPHAVYRFCTGDVDGDGREDAMVGVINKTRFFKHQGRRLFIFKNYKGRVRPLWLGSKLGGILCDFRFVNGKIRSIETTRSGKFVVAEYVWQGFGMGFQRFLAVKVEEGEALRIFNE